jgi:hypothetical protein
VVGHVVAEVGHGGAVEGREPQRVDAEPDEMVEVLGDAGEVADAISARVRERARVDLVDDGGLPPRHRHGRLLQATSVVAYLGW